MQELINLSQEYLLGSHSDAVAVAVLDFKSHTYESFEIFHHEVNLKSSKIFFDYASLTKPLTNSFLALKEKVSAKDLLLLLNHKAGLPAWGLLPKHGWKEQIQSYPIVESETLYSDFSALRFMLELEQKMGAQYQDLVFQNLDPEVKYWRNLTPDDLCVPNGFYHGKPNIGAVHDPNAYNLKEFTSHAGLFGTIDALAKSLIGFNKNNDLLDVLTPVLENKSSRFVYGFDTVENPEATLAGKGCSSSTFGHLGFTGTSFWIDAQRQKGWILLSNATKYFWFDKQELNLLRKKVGELVWQKF